MKIGFDEYSRKARIAPVLLAVLPLISLCYYLPQIAATLVAIPLLFVAAVGLLAEQITRYFGKSVERRLATKWKGLPTVRGLRHRAEVPKAVLKIRRRDVEKIARLTLPSQRDEQRDPTNSDIRYDDAVRRCLPKLHKEKHRLLFAENVSYGFRRNLYGLKPAALVIVAVSLVLNLYLAAYSGILASPISIMLAVLLVLVAAAWLLVVRERWVREQAETYAERFFFSIAA